jgi:hypothetical protein
VIEGADAEQPGNGKPVDAERRRVLEPGNKHKRDAQAESDNERAEMKQSPQKWPGQAIGQEVPIGHWAEAPRGSLARTGPA